MQAETQLSKPNRKARPFWRWLLYFSWGIPVIGGSAALGAIAGALLAKQQYRTFWVTGALAVAAAVPAAIWAYRSSENRRESIVTTVVFVVVAVLAVGAGMAAVYRTTPADGYLIEKAILTAAAYDAEGRTGHIQFVRRIRALEDGVSLFTVKDLGATGEVANIKASIRERPYEVKVDEEAGSWRVGVRLLNALRRGETVTVDLDLDVIKSKPEDFVAEYAGVTSPTSYLEINIVVPKARPCKKAEAWSQNGTKETEALPQLSEDRTHLTWHKQQPVRGREYAAFCYW